MQKEKNIQIDEIDKELNRSYVSSLLKVKGDEVISKPQPKISKLNKNLSLKHFDIFIIKIQSALQEANF